MAKTISYIYENEEQLKDFIEENKLHDFPSVLVQAFINTNNVEMVKHIQWLMNAYLPSATLIGTTSVGNFANGHIYEGHTIVSFTMFESTELKSIIFETENFNSGYHMGRELVRSLTSAHSKLIILFATDYQVDLQSLLDGIYEEDSRLAITGGLTGDGGLFHKGIVFTNDKYTESGVAAVVLRNENLSVQTYSNYHWQELGKPFTVTKSQGMKIESIDHKNPLKLLEYYLGNDFVEKLPNSSLEFPFLLPNNGEKVSVNIMKILNDGSIEVNRKVQEGDPLVFGYPFLKKFIQETIRDIRKLSRNQTETIFAYNCIAIKSILEDFVSAEVKQLHSIAPTAGCFCYGEISHLKRNTPQLVGYSLTYVAISEKKLQRKADSVNFQYSLPRDLEIVTYLTHFLQASQKELKSLNEDLTISRLQYRSLFNNHTDLVFSTNAAGTFTSVNPAFEKILGYTEDELICKSFMDIVKKEDRNEVRKHLLQVFKGNEQHYILEIPSKDKKGKFYFHITNIPIIVNRKCVGIYGIGRNITEQKKTEEQIRQLSFYDQDTGLPNRLKFTEKLKEILERAKEKKDIIALLVIDIDRFKIINDSLGHFAGDQILKEISIRIQQALPLGSYFGRFSGDKFNVVLSRNVTTDEAIKVAKDILNHVSSPLFYSNQEFFITASVGISMFPRDGIDERALMRNADTAMNRSKRLGGDRITLYSNEMNEEALARLEFESYLRKALHKNEFFLCYQPLIDLKTGELYGSEALIRWNHPKMGLVPPNQFIPLAEETGIIEEIGEWVLKTACKQNKKWQQMGLPHVTVSVNVSASQFQQPTFIDTVKEALKESGLEAKYLNLELTESTMLMNYEYSINVMESLQQLGVRVSIDDFGTGYSSLSYLKDLPINTLKIDRSFISNIHLDESDIAIVKAIITMGYGLAVKVVAEGVETKEQIDLLKKLNCHYAQGFYIHKPLTVDEFENALIQKEKMDNLKRKI